MEISELGKHCCTAEKLISYLRQKGENHNNYKYYSSLERIIEIRDKKCLYLNNGENWNDISDRSNFNSAANEFENFGKCFSFSQDESVAMWMLYGGINKLSGMIDFTKKGMQSIIKIPSINVGYFDDNETFHTIKTLELSKKEFEIYPMDIIYYSKKGDVYYINRSDESYNMLSEDVFEGITGCKKIYPWKYENECRLVVSISKKLINENCKFVQIKLDSIDLGKSLERIYRGPNYPLKNTYGSLPSKLDNTIDWSLCDGKTCFYNFYNNKGKDK